MTPLLSTEDSSALLSMSQAETNKTVAQMTALMSAISSGKENIDSMVSMLEKQPWYKKMLFTLTGKNKATVREIAKCKDKVAAYTSAALAQLYENSRIEQDQIIAVGQAVNSVNSQLAATNYEVLKTQEAVAEIKDSLIGTIGNLANKLNEKIQSVDNYHILLQEINLNTYDESNSLAAIFQILSRIDKRTAEDDRKMQLLFSAMANKGYLTNVEQPLSVYMHNIAKLPDNIAGTVYYELFSLNGNMYAEMFCELMDSYTLLPRIEKKSKKADVIISDILTEYDVESNTTFSTSELYEYFVDSKKEYLSSIQDIVVIEDTHNDIETDDADNSIISCDLSNNSQQLREESINSDLTIQAGERKVYSNCIIHFNADIYCNGSIVFDHCKIIYNEQPNGGRLKLNTKSEMIISHCDIICSCLTKEYFVKGQDECAEYYIFIENSKFMDCTNFLYGTLSARSVINHCKFLNCFWNVINVNNDKAIRITDCMFKNSAFPQYLIGISENDYDNQSVVYGNININNSYFENQINSSSISWNYVSNLNVITNCMFDGMSSGVEAKSIEYSLFKRCQIAISSSLIKKSIEHCIFECCEDCIENSHGDLFVNNCTFYNCSRKAIQNEGIIYINLCVFICNNNHEQENPIISTEIGYAQAVDLINKITNCLFYGFSCREKLIESYSIFNGVSKIGLSIEKCKFLNCTSREDHLFNTEITSRRTIGAFGFMNLSKPHTYHVVMTNNCQHTSTDKTISTITYTDKNGKNIGVTDIDFSTVGLS